MWRLRVRRLQEVPGGNPEGNRHPQGNPEQVDPREPRLDGGATEETHSQSSPDRHGLRSGLELFAAEVSRVND